MQIGPFSLEECRATVNGTPSLDEFTRTFEFVLYAQRYVNFWIGDIAKYGEARFGEKFYQAIGVEASPDLVARCVAVATKVPAQVRRPNLTWSHCREVTNLPPMVIPKVLEEMERRGIGSGQAREFVRKFRSGCMDAKKD